MFKSHASCAPGLEHESKLFFGMALDFLWLMQVVFRTKLGTRAESEDAETKAGARLQPC